MLLQATRFLGYHNKTFAEIIGLIDSFLGRKNHNMLHNKKVSQESRRFLTQGRMETIPRVMAIDHFHLMLDSTTGELEQRLCS